MKLSQHTLMHLDYYSYKNGIRNDHAIIRDNNVFTSRVNLYNNVVETIRARKFNFYKKYIC